MKHKVGLWTVGGGAGRQWMARCAVLLLAGVGGVACEPSNPGCRELAEPLQQGVLATFEVTTTEEGSLEDKIETFSVYVSNQTTAQQIWDLEAGTSNASIPNGKLLDGAGVDEHNAPWTWHLDPEDIEMAELTTEVCDAAPGYVEANKAEFISTVGRYCPWGARLVSVEYYTPEEYGGCG